MVSNHRPAPYQDAALPPSYRDEISRDAEVKAQRSCLPLTTRMNYHSLCTTPRDASYRR